MKALRFLIFFATLLLPAMATTAQIPGFAKKLINQGSPGFSEKEAGDAIREALQKGITSTVSLVSRTDGYFGNAEIKIPFPGEVRDIESRLRSVGMGNLADEVVLTMNRAAEDAAKEALPIFTSAITGMTLSDAIGIVRGPENAATQYLSRTTTSQLKDAFLPVVRRSLEKVNATRAWEAAVTAYNQIPFVKKQNTNLPDYVTGKAIDGMFTMVAKEELKIRKDPAGRTTDLLKKVFGNR